MLITFEGPEGGGKSTQVAAVAEYLRSIGRDVLITREPGSGEIGAEIRRLLLESGDVDPRTELFLFLADRSQHVHFTIEPALQAGKIVLCDRFIDSTVVYQGYGRGFEREWLRSLNRFATGGRMPDRTYLLDLPPELGLIRLESKDRMDRESLDFHERIRRGFLAESQLEPDRMIVVNATRPADQVCSEILQDLEPRL